MIYKRGIREVVDENVPRVLGVHVLLAYAAAAMVALALAVGGLAGVNDGYFTWEDYIRDSDVTIVFTTQYGWAGACADSTMMPSDPSVDPSFANGCYSLSRGADFSPSGKVAVPGAWLVRGAGAAVCLGQVFTAVVSGFFAIAFFMLWCNITLMPRGFMHLNVMGVAFIVSSLYLIFSCIVGFYLCVRGSLEDTQGSPDAVAPAWAYGLTVANVALLVVVGTVAFLDTAIDAAVSSPQYASTVKTEETLQKTLQRLRRRAGVGGGGGGDGDAGGGAIDEDDGDAKTEVGDESVAPSC